MTSDAGGRSGTLWVSGLRTDFSDRLSELSMPTLLIHGSRDRAVPVAWAQQRAPDCELEVFDGCGHVPPP